MSPLVEIVVIAAGLWVVSWLVMILLANDFRPDCYETPPSSCPPG